MQEGGGTREGALNWLRGNRPGPSGVDTTKEPAKWVLEERTWVALVEQMEKDYDKVFGGPEKLREVLPPSPESEEPGSG
jgi:hypothetical protein